MQEEPMRTALSRILGGLVASAAVPALAAGAASGTFSLDGATFKVVDAFAYERKAEFGDETAIRVRLSDKPLDRKALDAVLDLSGELDRQRGQGGSGKYVDLEFGKDGSYSGTSYSLGGRSNCGWCGDSRVAAKSNVKVEAGVLRGSMQIQPADYRDGKGPAISLTLDGPIATVSGATALPISGGEPAKDLDACRQAAKKKDAATVKTACFLPGDPQLASLENVTEEGFWMMALYGRESLKLATLRVMGGRTKGEWAELLVEGSGEEGARKGSVFLRRGPSGWRVDHEDLSYE
jgi:hypothetical protein